MRWSYNFRNIQLLFFITEYLHKTCLTIIVINKIYCLIRFLQWQFNFTIEFPHSPIFVSLQPGINMLEKKRFYRNNNRLISLYYRFMAYLGAASYKCECTLVCIWIIMYKYKFIWTVTGSTVRTKCNNSIMAN